METGLAVAEGRLDGGGAGDSSFDYGSDINRTYVHTSTLINNQNGMFSKQNISVADLIIRISNPFLLIPDNNALAHLCNYCLQKFPSLKKCTGCHIAVFCSKKCQSDGWNTYHKWECKAFKRVREDPHHPRDITGTLPTPVRGLIVWFQKYCKVHGVTESYFKDLINNLDHWKSNDSQNIALQSMAAIKYGGLRSWKDERDSTSGNFSSGPELLEQMQICWCILKTNAFRASSNSGPVGLCFEPILASANHSCEPNAEIGFESRTVYMRALREIHSGEEITISYIDEYQPLSVRQDLLRTNYIFECKCKRCWAEENSIGWPGLNSELDDGRERVGDATD